MTKPSITHSALTPDDIQAVSPALASYTQKAIAGDLWNRPGLSRRDRRIVTVSALITRIQTYSHFQFDAQASYKLPWGFQVYGYGLNLNNEVFGFYNGSPQYVVQREYYHPTYAGGLRWTSHHE